MRNDAQVRAICTIEINRSLFEAIFAGAVMHFTIYIYVYVCDFPLYALLPMLLCCSINCDELVGLDIYACMVFVF